MHSTHTFKPSALEPGAYWYCVPGMTAQICEKRDGEHFVRFTSGGQQSWIRDGECFVGPLEVPVINVVAATESA